MEEPVSDILKALKQVIQPKDPLMEVLAAQQASKLAALRERSQLEKKILELAVPLMADPRNMSVRGSARQRQPLDGANAPALEGALQQTEREQELSQLIAACDVVLDHDIATYSHAVGLSNLRAFVGRLHQLRSTNPGVAGAPAQEDPPTISAPAQEAPPKGGPTASASGEQAGVGEEKPLNLYEELGTVNDSLWNLLAGMKAHHDELVDLFDQNKLPPGWEMIEERCGRLVTAAGCSIDQFQLVLRRLRTSAAR
jgi:hypothetical protein